MNGGQATPTDRPVLYSTLEVGDKVVSPFTVSCGECPYVIASAFLTLSPIVVSPRPCRRGFSSRCVHSLLFGSPALEGGQAQYVRVPYAGGTLFRLSDLESHPTHGSQLTVLADSSLILLADIVPTGYFAALQLLQHPKLLHLLTRNPYPSPTLILENFIKKPPTSSTDAVNIALIGLGPVGIVRSAFFLSRKPIIRNPIPFYSALPSASLTSCGRTEYCTTGLSPSIPMKRGGNLSRRYTITSSKSNI